MSRSAKLGALALMVTATTAMAQDTTRVDLRLLYGNPKIRPGLVVLPAAGLDSVRAIVERDLDQSNRFEMIILPSVMALAQPGPVNLAPYRAMSATLALEFQASAGGLVVARLYDVASGLVRHEGTAVLDPAGAGEGRMAIHRLSDEVVRWATGSPGIAATRMLYVLNNRVWTVDADGAGARPATASGRTAYSPTWHPDGRRFAFTEFTDGKAAVVLQTLASSNRVLIPTTQTTTNITPAISPTGRSIVFSRAMDRAVFALHQVNLADLCCVERLTVGRFAENLSPTYSPDGQRIAFVSNRAGSPQIYVMSSDGTNQELFVPFDYGVTGGSFAPDWSPDGLKVAFHRAMAGGFQVLVFDLTTHRVQQVTSEGRNEDAAWAPDSRHLVFSSSRAGGRQLHILDLETSRVRRIPTSGFAQLASWSPRLGAMP